MGQISELKYGFYNSYKLDPNERFYATPFDVAYLSHITAQVVIIKPSGTIADGQINVDWYDADDVEVGSRSSHTITPTQLWSRKTATFEVPTGAVNAKLHFFGGEQGYNISCPMCEPGEIASAFSGEVASRLAYMSSEGGYFGLLNAGQIVAGKLIDPTEKAWFDLDKPEIVMKGTDADLYIDPANPLKVTDKNGNFIGGLKKKGNKTALIAGLLSNMENLNSYAEIGETSNGFKGLMLHPDENTTIMIAQAGDNAAVIDFNGHGFYIEDGYRFFDANYIERFNINVDGGFTFVDANNIDRLTIYPDGGLLICDGNGTQRVNIYPNGGFLFYDANNKLRAVIDSGSSEFLSPDETKKIGVDNVGGAYKIVSGTKTYL